MVFSLDLVFLLSSFNTRGLSLRRGILCTAFRSLCATHGVLCRNGEVGTQLSLNLEINLSIQIIKEKHNFFSAVFPELFPDRWLCLRLQPDTSSFIPHSSPRRWPSNCGKRGHAAVTDLFFGRSGPGLALERWTPQRASRHKKNPDVTRRSFLHHCSCLAMLHLAGILTDR